MWPEHRLGDLIKVEHGYAFRGDMFTPEPTPMLVLTPGNFAIGGGFQLRPGKEKYYNGEADAKYILRPGELLVTMTDLSQETDTLGYPAFVPNIVDAVCLHNQRLGKVLIQDTRALDLRFLYYVLCWEDYRDEVVASATGTAVKHTAPSRIEAFRFPLPSLSEQRRIAHVLGALDDKIDLNRKMNRTLEAIAQTLFRSWFVDFDPVVAKHEDRQPYGMDTETAALFPAHFQDSELGPIPEGWSIGSAYEIAEVIYGAPFASTKFNSTGVGLPLLRIRDLATNLPEVFTDEIHRNGHRVRAGDIVVGMDGEFRTYVWKGPDAWLNQRVCSFRCKDPYGTAFVAQSIREPLEFFETANTGTTVVHLGKADIDRVRIIIPTQLIAGAFGRIVDPQIDLTVRNAEENKTLSSLRDLLLPKLLSGEIRLKDAEKLTGESV